MTAPEVRSVTYVISPAELERAALDAAGLTDLDDTTDEVYWENGPEGPELWICVEKPDLPIGTTDV